MKKKFELLDQFAGLALQSIITKLPLLDKEGVLGEKYSAEDHNKIMLEVTESAYHYAHLMIVSRENAQKLLMAATFMEPKVFFIDTVRPIIESYIRKEITIGKLVEVLNETAKIQPNEPR